MNPASAYTLPVPKLNASSRARVRAYQYAISVSPSAPTWVPMCQPSAVRAIDPLSQPPVTSPIIMTNASRTTSIVRRSPARLKSSSSS